MIMVMAGWISASATVSAGLPAEVEAEMTDTEVPDSVPEDDDGAGEEQVRVCAPARAEGSPGPVFEIGQIKKALWFRRICR